MYRRPTIINLPHSFPDTDTKRAEHFIQRYGEDMLYCASLNTWAVWGDSRWVLNTSVKDHPEVYSRAKEHAMELENWASQLPDTNVNAKASRLAKSAQSRHSIESTIKLAQSVEGAYIETSKGFNQNLWLLNVVNGTIELKTGDLREHRREDLITQLIPFPYEEPQKVLNLNPMNSKVIAKWKSGHQCLHWLSFLDRVMGGNEELIRYVQRVAGYTLTGDTREKCFFVLYGPTNTGKTTFLEALRLLMADYVRVADINTFLHGRGDEKARENIARFEGARIVATAEPGKGKTFNEAMLKLLTGGDTVEARYLYRMAFEMDVGFKLFLATNDRPRITGRDDAIWNRVHSIPFQVQIPKTEQDGDLLGKLESEMPAILSWAVEGCLEWQKWGLDPPGEVIASTKEYKKEMDVIGEFLEDRCDIKRELVVQSSTLHRAFSGYCDEIGRREAKMNPNVFAEELEGRGFKRSKRQGRVYWQGLSPLGVSLQ